VGHRGENAAAGEAVLRAGQRLGPARIMAAAAAGAVDVAVYRPPRVASLVTGDELVPAHERPAGAAVRDCNGPLLRALVDEARCRFIDLGVVGDDVPRLTDAVEQGLKSAEVLCVSGGVSMGRHDHVPGVLADAGVQALVSKIAIKPGKPTRIGVGPEGQFVFGLPGNPVSCLVCFVLLVRPLLDGMQGREVAHPRALSAVLEEGVGPAGGRREYVPVHLSGDTSGNWHARPARWKGSGDPFGLARSDGLMVRDAHAPAAGPGTTVPVIPLNR
jgi:molybdopterin molybdotransferase